MICASPYCDTACDCREQKFAVLIKTALDAACELDCIKNVATISAEERERVAQLVERLFTACEEVQGEQA